VKYILQRNRNQETKEKSMDQKKQQADKADDLSRRDLMRTGAVAAAGLAVGAAQKASARTRSYNPQMKYRLLGRTGLWISSVCLGGHWKRVDKMVPGVFKDR